MLISRVGRVFAVVLLGFTGVTLPLLAQPLTPREKEMMELIEALKQRVTALEQRVDDAEKAAVDDAHVTASPAPSDAVVGDAPDGRAPEDFRVYWENGLNLETTDGQAKLEMGGRIHHDWFWYHQEDAFQDAIDLEDGTTFRRARVYLAGTLYENLEFEMEYDFAGGDANFKDVFLEIGQIPGIQNLRVGHFKEPFSLDELTSSNDITFMERALPNVFAPSRNTGVMAHAAFMGDNGAERMTAAAGIFRTTDDFGSDASDGGYSGTARVTGLPWYSDGGRRLVHLGAAYTHRSLDRSLRIRQRPEAGNAAHFLDTGEFEAKSIESVALEGAVSYDSFLLQGEYSFNDIETRYRGNLEFDGYYLQASYLLTGEHRPYKHGGGVFGQPKPKNNFRFYGENRGWGAWEVALRYSKLDLDDGLAPGWDRELQQFTVLGRGEQDNWTLGINWYLNPNARIMLNYVRADLDNSFYDGNLDILQTRFQLAF